VAEEALIGRQPVDLAPTCQVDGRRRGPPSRAAPARWCSRRDVGPPCSGGPAPSRR